MEIRSTQLSLLTQTTAASATRQPLPPLEAGQRLEAWVLGRQSPNQVLLELLGRRLLADTRLPLQTGDHLELEVVANRGTQPQLRIIAHTPQTSQVAAQALRTILPRQEPLSQVFTSLKQVADQPPLQTQLPSPVSEKLNFLLDSLPGRADLVQADNLKKVLRQSGLLSETKQMAASSPPALKPTGMDLKTRLAQLATLIRSLSPGSETPATQQTASTAPGRTGPNTSPSDPRLPVAGRQPGLSSQPSGPPLVPLSSAPAKPPTMTSGSPRPDNQPREPRPEPGPATKARSPFIPTPKEARPKPQPQPTQVAKETTEVRSARTPPLEETLELLSEKVSAAIARITLDQLASLPKADPSPLAWHFELPVRQDEAFEPLHLTLQGDPRPPGDEPDERPWSVVIEMEPAGLGKIQIRLILHAKQISAYFWSESEQTRELFERHMQTLAGNLLSQGLQPEHLQTVTGEPPVPTHPQPDIPLVDESI